MHMYESQQLRPIIDPIGQLPEFLLRLKRAEEARDASEAKA